MGETPAVKRSQPTIVVKCDGSYCPETKIMAYGFVVYPSGSSNPICTHQEVWTADDPTVGASNHIAEALAVHTALEWLAANGYQNERCRVYSDNQSLVRQLNTVSKVRSDDLHHLISSSKSIATDFNLCRFRWRRRSHNKVADKLAHSALRQAQVAVGFRTA